jgi:transcriptional regulator GlxA family with amidase domain
MAKTAWIVAMPETAGSGLYGMVDVLASTGRLFEDLSGLDRAEPLIRPRVVGVTGEPFDCLNAIPVRPEASIADDPEGEIVIVTELWLGPHDDLGGRYGDLLAWIRRRHAAGAWIYSACSGSVLLAASGLLDGCEVTSHWGYEDLFRNRFPKLRFRADSNLVFADPAGRVVTAGGATSWHDLAIHIIARHASPGDAVQIAKAFLLKWHGEGTQPYANLVRRQPHADSMVRQAESWLGANFREPHVVAGVVAASGAAERTLKRRFRAATGTTLMAYAQNLRIEEIKRRLETDPAPFEQIAAEVGYDNAAFARRLFKRATGLLPADYRRMFRPIAAG